MPRIHPVDPNTADSASRTLLEGIHKSLGMTPNLLATMAHSPAVLQAFTAFGQALSGAALSAAVREQIALAVAGESSCGYCASAHTALGRNAGVDPDELARNLRGEASDPRTQAAIDFARSVVSRRGWVDDGDLVAVRDAGLSEAEIVEVIAVVALNLFTNYFNHVAGTEIDFPVVEVGAPVTT